MKALIQRVRQATVSNGDYRADINCGAVILLGVGQEDKPEDAAYLARKTAQLRIFEDSQGKLNLSLLDIKGEALVVSQFTLYADTKRGNRPSFSQAATPLKAEQLYQHYTQELSKQGIPVKTGIFHSHMLVNIANDGPVTILLESR